MTLDTHGQPGQPAHPSQPHGTTWRRSPQPQLSVTATQHTDLVSLADRAATVLGEDTNQKLATWLARTRSGG